MVNGQLIDLLEDNKFYPVCKTFDNYFDFYFKVENGFNSVSDELKDKIRLLYGDKLMEFYYQNNHQHIYIRK